MFRKNTKKLKQESPLRLEWKNIKKSPILFVSLIVLLFIPSMYGGFFIGSIWDPYGNTSHLPVAVVNMDEGAELGDKKINIGKDLVETLKDEKSMGWEFISEEDADKGLDDGSYYMKISIPKDASKNVASISSDSPTKTTIAYTTTPSRNYVSSLLTRQAAETIAKNVSSKITNAYATSLLSQVDELKNGLAEASSGASQISSGTKSLESGISQYAAGVGNLKNGISQLSSGLPNSDQISKLNTALKGLESGIGQLDQALSNPDPALENQQSLVKSQAISLQAELLIPPIF